MKKVFLMFSRAGGALGLSFLLPNLTQTLVSRYMVLLGIVFCIHMDYAIYRDRINFFLTSLIPRVAKKNILSELE